MISAEALPFAKTGGLADVCGALPSRLAAMGHRCSVFLPGYTRALQAGYAMHDTHVGFVIEIGGKFVAARILKATLDDGLVDYYFIDQPHYYGRPHLYGDEHGDYNDNCERFSFFCRAVVQAIERLRLPVDIVHCHDWQSGLVPAYIRTRFGNHAWYDRAGSVMTIHNLAYQGRYWVHDMPLTGLDFQYFNSEQMEFYGDLCFLKTGIVFADMVTTVSPHYAKEIQQPEFGCALEGVLQKLGDRMIGIVNGVDYKQWDPLNDVTLPQTYSATNWKAGKSAAKAALQKELGLPVVDDVPLIGLIGRLASQKGWDLVITMLEHWASTRNVQWAVLGSGELRFQNALQEISKRFPDKIGARLEFSDRLAHAIEAGADMFLMPSQYEPCGLNQLYSLRYGTVPIVHAVGGLVDTVTGVTEATLNQRTATGFSFYNYDIGSLTRTTEQAIDLYQREKNIWAMVVETGMQQDWSWGKSAERYEAVYHRIVTDKRNKSH